MTGFAYSMVRYPGSCGVAGCLLGALVLLIVAGVIYALVTVYWWVTVVAGFAYVAYLKRRELMRMAIRAYQKK